MTINSMRPVRELAVTIPGATKIFEQFGIDYSCGGHRSLFDACRTRTIDVGDVVRSLETLQESPGDSRDWRQEPLTSLVEHIIDTHHCFTRQELDRLGRLFDNVLSLHAEKHPELWETRRLFAKLRQDLIPHMHMEEQTLFPYIARMEEALREQRAVPPSFFITVRNPVRMMMMEHDATGDLLIQLRSVTNGYLIPFDGCVSFQTLYRSLAALEADLHLHLHLENNILFPRAVEMGEASSQSNSRQIAASAS
jgi:regulator of cell morphogenesis and NO signaling